jgi:glycolate oxidase
VRTPRDDAERALMWKGRKSAFAAMGRISPNYYVQDGVIPRSEIGPVLREIAELARARGLARRQRLSRRRRQPAPARALRRAHPGQEALAEHVAGEILRICIRYGGSITGEHGVGADKAVYLGELFGEAISKR